MCDEEDIVLDACTVIDFCGRTDNLGQLLRYVGSRGVITSSVLGELERQRDKKYPLLQQFLDEVDAKTIRVLDPDSNDADVQRIVEAWEGVFGPGEVSSLALAVSTRSIFVSRDRGPMQQFALREDIGIRSTGDVLDWLVRRRAMTKQQADGFKKAIRKSGRKRRKS